MEQELTILNEDLHLVGISVRTNLKNEMNPATSKIKELADTYFSKDIASRIKNKSKPGITYAAYTDYESDENGDFTYFIGELVNEPNTDSPNLKSISIPSGKYQKFTTAAGIMPYIVMASWHIISGMDEKELGGKRNYIADFEVYDERARDPKKTALDIYVGLADS